MSTNEEKKTGKGLSLLLAAVPLLLAILLSLIAYFAGIFVSMFGQKIGTSTVELSKSDEGWIYLIQYLLYLIFFGVWYWYLIQKQEKEEYQSRHDKPHQEKAKKNSSAKKVNIKWDPVRYWAKRMPLLIILGYSLQLCVSGILAIFSTGFPDVFEAYKELIQSLSGSGVDIKTFIAVSFLAPIAEELLFRGVSYHYASRALPEKWAVIFQAVLFGIYHGNLIQFVYATVMGILLGMLRRQSGSVVPGIVLHIIINLSAYLIPAAWIDTVPKAALMTGLSLILIIPGCIILLKKPKKH